MELVFGLMLATSALARDASTPDWPCVQRKVVTVTSTQVWEGPPVDEITGWREDAEVSDLVELLANRRTPIKNADQAIRKFADGQAEPARSERLTLVFAGLFSKLQEQRKSVMARLESYLRAQRTRAFDLEQLGVAIANLEEKASTDEEAAKKLVDAQERFDLAQRIFQERQASIPFACELPVRIDQRAFSLGKSIHDLTAPPVTGQVPQ
jgi:hypothetical protein